MESYVYFRKCLPHMSRHALQVLTTCMVEKRCRVHVISHIRVHATYLKSSRRRLDPIWLDFKIILASSRKKWKDKEACSDEMLFQTIFEFSSMQLITYIRYQYLQITHFFPHFTSYLCLESQETKGTRALTLYFSIPIKFSGSPYSFK